MKPFMLGCLGFLLIPVAILVIVGTAANARATPAASVPAASALAESRVVGTWSAPGSNLTTEPFTVAGSSQRLDYQADKSKVGSSAQLCITVKQADGTHVRADCYQEHGTTRLYLKPGRYYLEIRVVSGPWTLALTDLP